MANSDPEMGGPSVEVRLAKLEMDMEWVKRALERVEARLTASRTGSGGSSGL